MAHAYLLALNRRICERTGPEIPHTHGRMPHTCAHATKQQSAEKKIISNISRELSPSISIFNFRAFPKYLAPINNSTDATKLPAYNRTTEQKRRKHNTINTHQIATNLQNYQLQRLGMHTPASGFGCSFHIRPVTRSLSSFLSPPEKKSAIFLWIIRPS